MTAALLEAHGHRAGVYLRPTRALVRAVLESVAPRSSPAEFAAAVERVARVGRGVNRTLAEGEAVTQFEAATAAAFVALAAARVEFGGDRGRPRRRLDATNVLPSRVTALTSVGSSTPSGSARPRRRSRREARGPARPLDLVLGRVGPEVERLAERTAAERNAGLVVAGDGPGAARAPRRLPAAQLRRRRGAAARWPSVGSTRTGRRAVAEGLELPGRVRGRSRATRRWSSMRRTTPTAPGRWPRRCPRPRRGARRRLLAILADKDAAGVLAALAPRLEVAVCTELPAERLGRAGRPGARALEASRLAALAERRRARRRRWSTSRRRRLRRAALAAGSGAACAGHRLSLPSAVRM